MVNFLLLVVVVATRTTIVEETLGWVVNGWKWLKWMENNRDKLLDMSIEGERLAGDNG